MFIIGRLKYINTNVESWFSGFFPPLTEFWLSTSPFSYATMHLMKKFKPHDTYELLRKQAFAMHQLLISYEAQLHRLTKKDYSMSKATLRRLEEELESERAMNELLTNELESQRIHYNLPKIFPPAGELKPLPVRKFNHEKTEESD